MVNVFEAHSHEREKAAGCRAVKVIHWRAPVFLALEVAARAMPDGKKPPLLQAGGREAKSTLLPRGGSAASAEVV